MKNGNKPPQVFDLFASSVFNHDVMKKMLPQDVYDNVLQAEKGLAKIDPAHADVIALAMKEWAVSHGATHYTHWFLPLTGISAEKHDSFLSLSDADGVLQSFSGINLLQGEPDASSFPSGGLRSTFEARGYTGWDPMSPAFLWKGGEGLSTLCIPSVFFSWTGEALDTKIPLIRSEIKLQSAILRLLKEVGIKAAHIHATVGVEQEFFLIPEHLRNLRPDLVLQERTVYGLPPARGQELQDHYLGSIKDPVLSFMQDLEVEALKLGIPLKTRHNEVAPSQFEIAPIFEKASKAVDHNILMMELMRRVAGRHGLSCLLHEKPFKDSNGSGKHCNWSLMTDTEINLLDPSDTPGNNLHFLILITAILNAIHEHAILLRASIGSYSNDCRLGGHEAPPAIISAYLGEAIETVLNHIEEKGPHTQVYKKEIFDLGIPHMPDLKKDYTDRNRTSPFAFTGNKFEFRAVGSSMNPAFPVTILNAIVAESLEKILNEIGSSKKKSFLEAAIPILQKFLKSSKPVRFTGDNYSIDWKKEAKKRNLPFVTKSIEAFQSYLTPATAKALQGIFTKTEIKSRYGVSCENYMVQMNIDLDLMLDLFNTQILPAALEYQKNMAKSIEKVKTTPKEQTKRLRLLTELIEETLKIANGLEKSQVRKSTQMSPQNMVKYVTQTSEKMEVLRESVDALEKIVDDRLWPLPKYRELLFSL
jgi:glutamine synthetase